MQINTLTPDYAVAGQISADDMAALSQAGFTAVICNRPDSEVDSALDSQVMAKAAVAAGLQFIFNPVVNGGMSEENVSTQSAAMSEAEGPVFAYCRSGMRSAIVWALGQAGQSSPDDLIAAAARGGYDLSPMRAQLIAAADRS